MRENENCRNFVWIRETKPLRYVGFCLLGQCPCIKEDPDILCFFYEEEKNENTETVSAEDDR